MLESLGNYLTVFRSHAIYTWAEEYVFTLPCNVINSGRWAYWCQDEQNRVVSWRKENSLILNEAWWHMAYLLHSGGGSCQVRSSKPSSATKRVDVLPQQQRQQQQPKDINQVLILCQVWCCFVHGFVACICFTWLKSLSIFFRRQVL